MPQETFADRLSRAMGEKSLKQADLIHAAALRGEKLGKSQVSQYVSGKVVPRAPTLRLLAEILGVPEAWLATGDDARAAARPETAIPSPSDNTSTKRSATMREFKKSSKLDNVLYDVRGPVADEAARMEDEGLRILKLNIGNPAPLASVRPTRSSTTCVSSCRSARATRTRAACSPRARRSCSTPSSSTCPT